MSWWWSWGAGTGESDPGTTADNAPSLWSGGVRWGDPAAPFGDGTDAYWGSVSAVTGRTGRPRLSVAIGGALVLEQLMEADWDLGRSDWLSVLTPASASFRFVDVPVGEVNDSVVVGLMSDATEYHSDSLWVGRVTNISTDEDITGLVFSTISATDVVGILGQADSPASIVSGHTLQTLAEELAENAGIGLEVDTDALVTLPTLTAASDLSGKVLDLINRAERSSNALLFLKGNGRLHAAMRDTTSASSVVVIDLEGDDSPSGWSRTKGIDSVITTWVLGAEGSWGPIETAATTLEDYGEQAYSATDLLINDPAPYAALIASDVMAHPRFILTQAPIPVRDLAQKALYLNPLDRVTRDGETWQVMSVHHTVRPIEVEGDLISAYGDWRVTIGADATQEALVGATEPGPVTPPGLNTVTLDFTSTKSAWVFRHAGTGATGASGTDSELLVGKTGDGKVYRSYIEFPIVWPANTIRVVSAVLHLHTVFAEDDARVHVQRITESWTEGGLSWGGPSTTAEGRRSVTVPPGDERDHDIGISAIAEAWRATGENHGVHLRNANEDASFRWAGYYSDDASPADRPTLTLIVEVIS
jgi:hypothetical protein